MDNLEDEANLMDSLLDVIGSDAPDDFRAEMQDVARKSRDLADLIKRIETDAIPVRIAVVGDFSSGKSSFINSILQDPTLCPERADPTTSLVTTFTYGLEEYILQHHGDGRAIAVSRAQYAEMVQTPQEASTPVHFTFQLPNPLLRNLELVDTPGFNNRANPYDSQVTTGIMKSADAFFYLVDANTGTIAETGLEQVRLIKQESSEAQVFLLISKADQKATSALERIKARCKKEYTQLFHDRIFTYSSLKARSDLDSRDDLAELFHVFQRDKATLTRRTLKRRLKAHRDFRLTQVTSLMETLHQLVGSLAEEVQSIEDIISTTMKRLVEVLEGEQGHFYEELAEAVFTYVDPVEIKGSGWITDDAKIHFESKLFKEAILAFSSFDVIEKALHDAINIIFENTRQDLHEDVRDRLLSARKSCAWTAELEVETQWNSDFNKIFSDIEKAAKYYDLVSKDRTITIAETVWSKWMTAFDSLMDKLADEDEPLDAHINALNERREALVAGLHQWKNLVDGMPDHNL